MDPILQNVTLVFIGLVMLYFGSKWLVTGSTTLARKLNISKLVIGTTIVAFGTSTPELGVSVAAVLNGYPDVTIGNIVGSNIANIGLILATTAILTPIVVTKKTLKKEIPLVIIVSLVLIAYSVDGMISKIEGVLLMAGAACFIYLTYRYSKKSTEDAPMQDSSVNGYVLKEGRCPFLKAVFLTGAGIAFLSISSFLTVDNAVAIAEHFGVPQLIIGITLIAIGTSLPELATSLISIRKKELDLSLGNILGSNIFNVLVIAGVTASLSGLSVTSQVYYDYLAMMVFSIILIPLLLKKMVLNKVRGILLLAGYLVYISMQFLV